MEGADTGRQAWVWWKMHESQPVAPVCSMKSKAGYSLRAWAEDRVWDVSGEGGVKLSGSGWQGG